MGANPIAFAKWLLGPEIPGDSRPGHLWARWIFLRALGLIYFSAFYSLLFQIKGLIGPDGILPAADYLQAVAGALHAQRFWFAPTLLWFNASNQALMLVCWVGLIASLLVVMNFWPRATLVVCFICFLSFVSAAQDFSNYQSDGMLLEAGFISIFFAPPGIWPGLARAHAASRLSRFLLQWEWFRIYFESGLVKILSGDQSWRNLTAMDDYYQNGPLPSWIGWYVQHLPHWFHASAVVYTFLVELFVVWLLFFPRRLRILCFLIVTPFEISIILTANYTFLNYLVLLLGVLLLDDRFLEWVIPQRLRDLVEPKPVLPPTPDSSPESQPQPSSESWRALWRRRLTHTRLVIAAFFLLWIFYSTTAQLIWTIDRKIYLPVEPIARLEPFRIANRYGLFAIMTHARYEIEFQGSRDGGKTWLTYPFLYKPQDVNKAPGIYAPYQPRFEWNLWFASLGNWRQYHFVVWTEERLLRSDTDVVELFASNPFGGGSPPTQIRAVMWQYWFTDMQTKRATGAWWRREFLGNYAPGLERLPDGKIILNDVAITEAPPP